MSIWAVIPAKDPHLAKSRLAGVLSPSDRHDLSLRLLAHTLRAVQATPAIARCLVVSASQEVLDLVDRYGAMGLAEPDTDVAAAPRGRGIRHEDASPDVRLNAAIAHGSSVAADNGATAVLVLASDLPLISPRDLRQLPKWLPPHGGVVLVPDHALTGTNALLVQPPQRWLYQFGPDSLARHKRAARLHGLQVVVWSTPALRMDLDTPQDLLDIRSRAGANSPAAGLLAFGEPPAAITGSAAPPQLPAPGRGSLRPDRAAHGNSRATPIDFAAAARRLRARAASPEQQ